MPFLQYQDGGGVFHKGVRERRRNAIAPEIANGFVDDHFSTRTALAE
jgi:hypothetical protein